MVLAVAVADDEPATVFVDGSAERGGPPQEDRLRGIRYVEDYGLMDNVGADSLNEGAPVFEGEVFAGVDRR